jgi:serine/threonine protein kinase
VRCSWDPTVELYTGQELNEQLRLVRPLAHGGMAVLWVAEHRALGTQVVVKILSPEVPQRSIARRRLVLEGRLTARVLSPHVVRVFDGEGGVVGEDLEPFLVMELLRGEDLAARILRMGRLSITETLTIVEHVSLALEKAHGAGIVHRDVKPENVFLAETPDGIVAKLLDFGIAKDASESEIGLTRADALMGSLPYMSPEQVVSPRDVDSRCDVWSLAVLAYSCLTGGTPFDGATLGALCVAIHRGQFDPPSFRRAELSASVDTFFAKALSHRIELRYSSARALYEAFREAARSYAKRDANGEPGTPQRSGDAAFFTARALLRLDELQQARERLDTDNVTFDLARPKSGVRAMCPSGPSRECRRRGRM